MSSAYFPNTSPTEMDKSHLLAEIACRPAIWDTRITFSVRRPQMLLDWPAVARAVNSSVDECKRRWKGLRGNYRSELRRSHEPSKVCRWRYFHEMEFMRGVFSDPSPCVAPPAKRPKLQLEIFSPALAVGGLRFEEPESLFEVLDELEVGLDIDEELTKLLGSENWLWDPNLDLTFPLDEVPIPSQPLDLRKHAESNDPDHTYLMSLLPTVQALSDRSRQRFRILATNLLERVMAKDQQRQHLHKA
ncbi:uncharacterized protein LOC108032968 [Drosophila biarmipes]|uniref:uncharacterized protein LOC108032968 n=1 Tax=Drosophila biarmipes TaxID=125945 RepID=UPI0007E7D6C4|nr:uncharacterized protein LOC108032968 [Drosophila biarmipes]